MLKQIVAGCGAGLFSLLTALPVHAQVVATLVLRDGQRPAGELIDLNASGFAVRINGQERVFPANEVAAVEFAVGAPPAEARGRIDAGQPFVLLRSGEIIDGRLFDIGGTRPLRLTIDTPSGQRDYTSNDVAQIYMFGPRRAVAAAPAPAQAAPPAGAIVVQANQPWTDTGITVARNERVAFAGAGDIMMGPGASSGVGGSPAVTSPAIRYPVFSSPRGALIARVGNGVPFAIGPNTQPIAMPAAGRLFLGVNDDEVGDNSGAYTVTVTRLGR